MEALSSPAISEVFHLSLQLAPCRLQNLTNLSNYLSNYPTTTYLYTLHLLVSTIMMQISTITTLSLLLTPCIASPMQRSSAIRFQIAIIPSEMEVATSQNCFHRFHSGIYEEVSDLGYNWVAQIPDFNSALRVVKMVLNTQSYLYLWLTMWFHANRINQTLKKSKSLNTLYNLGFQPQSFQK